MGKLGLICSKTHLQFGHSSIKILAVAFFFELSGHHFLDLRIRVHFLKKSPQKSNFSKHGLLQQDSIIEMYATP